MHCARTTSPGTDAMPTARELLEQADALMRRNRANTLDDIPVLTDAMPAVAFAKAPPAADVPDDAGPPSVPLLTDDIEVIDDDATLGVEAVEGEPSAWLEFEDDNPSVIGDAPDSIAIVPPVQMRSAPFDEALLASAEHEEIEFTLPAEEMPTAGVSADIAPADTAAVDRAEIVAADAVAADEEGFEAESAAAIEAATATAIAADADAAERADFGAIDEAAVDTADNGVAETSLQEAFVAAPVAVPPAPVPLSPPAILPPTAVATPPVVAAGLVAWAAAVPAEAAAATPAPVAAPAIPVVAPVAPAAPAMADDDERWVAAAEEIRMQVLQRIDLFTDTGLRDQLAQRLQPIADRASADFVKTINLHVGDLLRTYVAEAIEREIERWRRDH